jgi:hypothetical protein
MPVTALDLARQGPRLAAIQHLAKLPEHGFLEFGRMQAPLMAAKQFMARPAHQGFGLTIEIEDLAAIAIRQEKRIP